MTFESEEVQTKFHELPTQTQLDYCGFEVLLAQSGKRLHVSEVSVLEEELQVIIRIDEKFKLSARGES